MLDKLLDFSKDRSGLFFISQGLHYLGVVEELFKDQIDYALLYLGIYFPHYLPVPLGTFFPNNVDVKVGVDSLFNNFEAMALSFSLFLIYAVVVDTTLVPSIEF